MSDTAAQLKASINSLNKEFSIISHNLANVSTVGYKRRFGEFSKYLKAAQQTGQLPQDPDAKINELLDLSQGNLIHTQRTLDVSLQGKGFFTLETPQGPLYTRKGIFSTNANGQIVTTDGKLVAGTNGPISIPAMVSTSQLCISEDGTISANGISIGKFEIVDFPENIDKMVSVGSSCFKMTKNVKPVPAESVTLKQGYQESSNVQMMEELVDLIMVSRMYEANMRFITGKKEPGKSLMNVAMG